MSQSSAAGLQPLLHLLTTCLAAPTVTLSDADGQIRPLGAQGMFSADLRALSRAEVSVRTEEAAAPIEFVSQHSRGAAEAEFVAVLRTFGTPGPDPTVWLRRRRTVSSGGMAEHLAVENFSDEAISLELRLDLASDMADMEQVKAGLAEFDGVTVSPLIVGTTPFEVRFAAHEVIVTVLAPAARVVASGDDGVTVAWLLEVAGRSAVEVEWSATVGDHGAAVVAPRSVWSARVRVTSSDDRWDRLVSRSVADLAALRMAAAASPADEFFAAGSPWYFTLFGRDSIWAARMMLPVSLATAAGTLRTLAKWQGEKEDSLTAEEPGKILHELRRPNSSLPDPFLPPMYFGTVDATPLWICLLSDAWRWGLPADEVEALIPALERALGWIADYGDSDGDGLLEYIDRSGRGLANQGWKDSGDSIRFADGRIATGPVALAEVQGYAYEAALAGAQLLETFGRPGAQAWRGYAIALKQRFREKFWVSDALGRYPALALDGDKVPVDAPASNMGHLLGTGILDADEIALTANRLAHPSMSSGFGLRTMATTAGGYSPLSYHCGSVWPHDTAIGAAGLARTGHPVEAKVLLDGLVAAGAAFDGRLPELYGGFSVEESPLPVPYPASCRPQAWSAAAAIAMVTAVLGLDVDVPAGVLRLSPSPSMTDFAVSGLRIGEHPLAVGVKAGHVSIDYAGPLQVRVD